MSSDVESGSALSLLLLTKPFYEPFSDVVSGSVFSLLLLLLLGRPDITVMVDWA